MGLLVLSREVPMLTFAGLHVPPRKLTIVTFAEFVHVLRAELSHVTTSATYLH